jgi:hypothetical protein
MSQTAISGCIRKAGNNMLTIFEVLEGALNHLEDLEGIDPHEVHDVEIEISEMSTQCACVEFPEHNYMCFTYGDWRKGDFIGFRI